MEVVQSIQQLTASVMKARELYQQRSAEVRRLQEAAQPSKDTDKAEAKLKKAAEEYRALVDKYRTVRDDFERKMVVSCRVSAGRWGRGGGGLGSVGHGTE